MGTQVKILALLVVGLFLISMSVLSQTVVKAETKTDNWVMFQNNPSRTGFTASDGPNKPDILWRFIAQEFSSHTLDYSPIVYQGIVYAGFKDGYKGNVIAFNAYTGTKIWNYSTYTFVLTTPIVSESKLIFGVGRFVYALDLLTGTKLWDFESSNSVGSSLIINGVVFVGSLDANIYAINASTGSKLWNFTTRNNEGGHGVNSTPAFENGILYMGAGDRTFYAINASTGSQIWAIPNIAPYSSATINNGKVYFGSYQEIYCLDSQTGKQLWNFSVIKTLVDGITSAPALANGILYVGSPDGYIYALNSTTGKQIWSYNTKLLDSISSPAIANGVLYVGVLDSTYALNATTGDIIWSYQTDNKINSSPAISDGILYIGALDGSFYAIGESPQTNQVLPTIAVGAVIVVLLVAVTSVVLYRRHRKTTK